MNKKNLAYVLIIASSILLIINLTNKNYFGIISNVLLIISMILVLRGIDKNENKN